MGAKIISVESGSLADVGGIKEGDELVAINGNNLNDVLDYQFFSQDEHINLQLRREGRLFVASIENRDDQGLGIMFASSVFDKVMTCKNSCKFCFVDQLPGGLRSSLYIKDDDYRLSFLYGNFITLTNLEDGDLKRIISQRLSPIYASLHSTDKDIRKDLIRPRVEDRALESLDRLIAGGIETHIQIVLCPGINDGPALTATISELTDMGVASIGIVPVGLTGHRGGLAEIEPVDSKVAKELIKTITEIQEANLENIGRRTVFMADEFYLVADEKLPKSGSYEGYPQVENGIGLSRIFLDQVESRMEAEKIFFSKREHTVLTSTMAAPVLSQAIESINRRSNGRIRIIDVKNTFFGAQVSVAGLLTGADILACRDRFTKGDSVLVPDITLNQDRLFLDGISEEEIMKDVVFDLRFTPSTGSAFIDFLLEKAG